MIDFETLQVVNYDVIEKTYNKKGELKGYIAEITLQTYIERDFYWLYNISKRLENFATKKNKSKTHKRTDAKNN